jgi:hypothetical protein
LYFNIIRYSCAVGGVDIEPDGPSLQIFNRMLDLDFLHLQIWFLQDNMQQEFGTLYTAFKAAGKEIVIKKAQ